jgi:hypothetical protein
VQGLFLLTMKPVTYAANVAEGDLGDQVFHESSACVPVRQAIGRHSCRQQHSCKPQCSQLTQSPCDACIIAGCRVPRTPTCRR